MNMGKVREIGEEEYINYQQRVISRLRKRLDKERLMNRMLYDRLTNMIKHYRKRRNDDLCINMRSLDLDS